MQAMSPMTTSLLDDLLQDWKQLLTNWARGGTLSRAAQEALLLEGEDQDLRDLVSEWSEGSFGNLPPVVLLPGANMPGAAGAYAASSGTIYLNATWLAGAEALAVQAVLTEELGHHLDALLNSSDTPGDEGALFAALLMGEALSAGQRAALQAEDDGGIVMVAGAAVAVEMDNITGTEGPDNLVGTAGGDSISGLGENDQLYGMGANDTLDGGEGDDYLDPGAGLDIVIGGAGSDRMVSDRSSETVGAAAKFFSTLPAAPLADGTTLAVEGVESSLVIAGSGNDSLDFSSAAGSDIVGLYGHNGDDYLRAGAGNDNLNTFFGYGYGVTGEPRWGGLFGGAGNDTLDGGAGDDYLDPGSGNQEVVIGGSGTDLMVVDRRSETGATIARYYASLPVAPLADGTTLAIEGIEKAAFTAGSGDDDLDFSAIESTGVVGLYGNNGDDYLRGGLGNDDLNTIILPWHQSPTGADIRGGLYGGAGNDTLDGGAGNDYLSGDSGDDRLVGTSNGKDEADYLSGGSGQDTFVLGNLRSSFYDDGNSVAAGLADYALISDFDPVVDRIELHGASVIYRLTVAGNDSHLWLNKLGAEPDELIAIIKNQTVLDLEAPYFIYAGSQTAPTVTLEITTPEVKEGSFFPLTYTFSRSGSTDEALQVNFSINGTAQYGPDYSVTGSSAINGNTGSVVFAPGQRVANLEIYANVDLEEESDETVALSLEPGSAYGIVSSEPVTGLIRQSYTIPVDQTVFGGFLNPGVTRFYRFTAALGDSFLITMGRPVGSSVNPRWQLYAPDNSLVKTVEAGVLASADVKAALAGTYILEISDYQNNNAGLYSLSVLRTNNATSAIDLPLDGVVTGTLATGADFKSYSFSAAEGDTFLINIGRSAGSGVDPSWRLYGPDGTLVKTAETPISQALADVTASQGGTYTLLVGDYEANDAGEYSLSLRRTNNTTSAIDLPLDGVVTGTLATGADFKSYSFSAAEGDTFLINMGRSAGSGLDPSWRLYGPDGSLVRVAETPFSQAIADVALSQAGDYTLLVGDYASNDTGDYSLSLRCTNNPVNALDLPLDAVVTGTLSAGTDVKTYSFTAATGDTFLISMGRPDGSGVDPSWRLYGPDGSLVTTRADWTQAIADVALSQAGAYTLLVGDYESNDSGDYSLSLRRTNNPVNALDLPLDAVVTGTLSAGTDVKTYSFTAAAGDTFLISMGRPDGSGLDPSWRLYGPDGSLVRVAETPFSQAIADVTLSQAGAYTLLVGDYESNDSGDYSLSLRRTNNPVNALALPLDAVVTGTLTAGSDVKTYSFTAAAGDTFLISMGRPDGSGVDPSWRLYGPDGTLVRVAETPFSQAIADVALSQAGAYTLLVGDYQSNDSGDYNLSAWRNPKLDAGVISLASVSYAVQERGNPVAIISIIRTGGSQGAITGSLKLSESSAKQYQDFISGCIGFSLHDGETAKEILVPIANDRMWEGDEEISIELAIETNGVPLGFQSKGTIKIQDDDQPTITSLLNTSSGSNLGKTTIVIAGEKFKPGQNIALVSEDNNRFVAEKVYWVSSTELWATFDLRGLSMGNYRLQIEGDHTQSLFSSPFVINDDQPGSLIFEHEYPNASIGSTHKYTLTYRNNTQTDIPAPLLNFYALQWQGLEWVPTKRGISGLPPQNSESALLRELLGYQLGISSLGPAGTIAPGASGSISFDYTATEEQSFTPKFIQPSQHTTIDWNQIREQANQSDLNQQALDAIWTNITESLGRSLSSFQTEMSKNASYLSSLGTRTSNLSRLFAMEWQQASNAQVSPVFTTVTDVSLESQGLDLRFERAFLSSIVERYQTGILGRGWTHNYERRLEQESSTTLAIRGVGGRQKLFMLNGSNYIASDQSEIAIEDGHYIHKTTNGQLEIYGADGLLQQIRDTNNHSIDLSYANGLLTELRHSDGSWIHLAYNTSGLINLVHSSASDIVQLSYDSDQHLASAESAFSRTEYFYNEGNELNLRHLPQKIVVNGDQYSFNYDRFGRLTSSSLNGVLKFQYSYQQEGEVIASVGSLPQISSFVDDFGSLRRINDSQGNVVFTRFDKSGNITHRQAQDRAADSFEYDENGNLVRSQNAANLSVNYTYSDLNRLSSFRDPKGNGVDYTYDQAGNLLRHTYADGSQESFARDAKGNLIVSTSRSGSSVSYTYDAHGRLITKESSGSRETLENPGQPRENTRVCVGADWVHGHQAARIR